MGSKSRKKRAARDANAEPLPAEKAEVVARLEAELAAKEAALTAERERLRALEKKLKAWAAELAVCASAAQRPATRAPVPPQIMMREFDEALNRASQLLTCPDASDGRPGKS